jgi:hypothetical protein
MENLKEIFTEISSYMFVIVLAIYTMYDLLTWIIDALLEDKSKDKPTCKDKKLLRKFKKEIETFPKMMFYVNSLFCLSCALSETDIGYSTILLVLCYGISNEIIFVEIMLLKKSYEMDNFMMQLIIIASVMEYCIETFEKLVIKKQKNKKKVGCGVLWNTNN